MMRDPAELDRRSRAGRKAAAFRRGRRETPFAALERRNAALDAIEGRPVRGSARGDFTAAEIIARIRARADRAE